MEMEGLGRPRLVVLSACETGLYDIGFNPNEFFGLPGTFIAIGAAGVVATLWPVSDAASALLMAKFYELHMGQRLDPPTALARAQAWLRRGSNSELQSYARVANKEGRFDGRYMAEIVQELSEEGLKRSRNNAVIGWTQSSTTPSKGKRQTETVRPYMHPYFWAGFIYTGL